MSTEILALIFLNTTNVALLVKDSPAMQETQETWVQSVGQEDTLKK